MRAVFKELTIFQKCRPDYLSDDEFSEMQQFLLRNPEAGDVIQETGGLRKLRWIDSRRGKGKRGGVRVIYYWYFGEQQFWLFTIYDKDEAADISREQKKVLRALLEAELAARRAES